MRRDSAPEPSASVYVQPAPHGSWSGNNNFGFKLPFGPQRTNRERIVNLSEWGEPRVWTVSLGIDFSDNNWPGTPRGFDVVAEVAFGVGGATETVLMDWISGTTFSVPANAISINATWAFPETAGADSARPNDVTLRVLLSRGGRGGGLAPTKFATLLDGEPYVTVFNNVVAEPLARIPKFAKKLFLIPLRRSDYTNLLASNNFVRFFTAPDPPATARSAGTYRIDQALLLSGIPVPAFAKYATIENVGGGAGFAWVQLNFELSL